MNLTLLASSKSLNFEPNFALALRCQSRMALRFARRIPARLNTALADPLPTMGLLLHCAASAGVDESAKILMAAAAPTTGVLGVVAVAVTAAIVNTVALIVWLSLLMFMMKLLKGFG